MIYMDKVLLAFDGQHFSDEVFQFVKQMNEVRPVMAVAIFLSSIDYGEILYSYGGVVAGPVMTTDFVPADDVLTQKNITLFKELCEQHKIKYKVHEDFGEDIIAKVKTESRFADLLVLGAASFYSNLENDVQDDYIATIFHKAECPVIMVPKDYKKTENIFIAYDGSEQSVFAIKQFAYLFPGLCHLPTLLVYFNKSKDGVPDRDKIEELVNAHFSNATISKLKLDPKKDVLQYIEQNGATLLVSGAFGRSLLSETFRQSFITDALHLRKLPIFVTHK